MRQETRSLQTASRTTPSTLPETVGGFSGGTMDRPRLQRLLKDVHSGQVDVIVDALPAGERQVPGLPHDPR
ncbi:MAG TPA: recombinase family protein [Chloroflexota bacterium]|nr:recombinase family protein [Chloroflexota bacterium]